jgi:hypothetical protein
MGEGWQRAVRAATRTRQPQREQQHQEQLARFYEAKGYTVTGAGMRWTLARPGEPDMDVVVKVDGEAARTERIFVELGHVSAIARPNGDGQSHATWDGWLHTLDVEWVVYYIPPRREIFVLSPRVLREHALAWFRRHRITVSSQHLSPDSVSVGICVPIQEVAELAQESYHV